MRKRIYALVSAVIIIALLAVGFWAYSAGKFAGLADVVKEKPKTTAVGVLVDVQDNSVPVAGALVHVCPHKIDAPSIPVCDDHLGGQTNTQGLFDFSPTSPICTNDPRPFSDISFYVSKAGYNTTLYRTVNIDKYCSEKNNLYFSLTKGANISPPPLPTPPATEKVDLTISIGDKLDQQRPISGIPVVIDGTSRGKTDTNGYVVLKEITSDSHKLSINTFQFGENNEKYDQIIVPSFIVKNQGINPANGIGRQTAHFDLDLLNWNQIFILQGKITGPDGQLLDWVNIKAACVNCGLGPWEGSSGGDEEAYGNYQVKGIYNINQAGVNDAIFVKLSKDGYIYDPNNDGQEDSIRIDKSEIVWQFNHFEAKKDFQLKGRSDKFTINIKTGFDCQSSTSTPVVNYVITNSLVSSENINVKNGDSFGGGTATFGPLTLLGDSIYTVAVSIPGFPAKEYEFQGKDVPQISGVYSYSIDAKFSGNKACLRGVVTDIDTNKPISNASVSLIKGNTITTSLATTNSRGEYSLESEAGNFTIFIYHPYYYDNQRAVKNITLHQGENKQDFQLKFVPFQKYYDLYIKLVDEQNNPIDFEKEDFRVNVRDFLRSELYVNGDYSIVTKNNQKYVLVRNVPCGRELEIWVWGGFNTYSGTKQNTNYDCPNNQIENFIDMRLKRRVPPDNNPNDPKKPDVDGKVIIDILNFCGENYNGPGGLGGLFYNKEDEGIPIEVILQNPSTRQDYRSVILRENGEFRFVDVDPGEYNIFVRSNSYKQSVEKIRVKQGGGNNKINLTLEIKDINSYQKVIKNINGTDVYFWGPSSQKYMDRINWENVTLKYSLISIMLNVNVLPKPIILPVYIMDTRGTSFMSATYNYLCNKSVIWIDSDYIPENKDLEGTLFHEYGHHVHAYLDKNLTAEWKELFIAADRYANGCVFSSLRDSNLSGVYDRGGHPWDNDKEFFATFFMDYFFHHDKLLAMINSLPKGSDCRNILEYAWQFFAEKVAKTPPAENPSTVIDSSIRLYSNDDEIFGPVVGGKIGNTIYTPDQIRKGLWKQSVYNNSSVSQKISVQLTRTISAIYQKLNINPTKFKNQIDIYVAKFNSFIDSLVSFKNKGNIKGTVYANVSGAGDEPRQNAIVLIGNKMAITDSDGKFSISGAKAEEQKVRLIDGETKMDLTADPETVTIQKDQTINIILRGN